MNKPQVYVCPPILNPAPSRNREINIFLWERTPSCPLPSVTFSPSHTKSGT